MSKINLYISILLFTVIFSCRKSNEIAQEELFTTPKKITELKKEYYKYKFDTLTQNTLYLFNNIEPDKSKKLPKKLIGFANDYTLLYNYINKNNNGIYVAYVKNEKNILFREILIENKVNKEGIPISDKEVINFLNEKKMKYKILKNKYNPNYYGNNMDIIIYGKEKDSTFNRINISKTLLNICTYNNIKDTIYNWQDSTQNLLK